MSYAINPKRIEDEAFELLHYADGGEVDSFTLNRLCQKLENAINSSSFDAKTFCALGLVLFNMGKYDLFIEEHKRGKRFFQHNIELHNHHILGLFRMVSKKIVDIPDFDLYNAWFDPKINQFDTEFSFGFGSGRIILGDQIVPLRKNLIASITLYANRRMNVEIGPFNFDREYDEFKKENMNIEMSFSWEVIEKIRTGTLTEIESSYLKEILGDQHSTFMSYADPDYSELLDTDNGTEGDESYNSVDEFMESLMI